MAIEKWLTDDGVQNWQYSKSRNSDVLILAGGVWFDVEYKSGTDINLIMRAIHRFNNLTNEHIVPLIVVPYMSPEGRELCRTARISWLDLSGNAEISGDGLRIKVLGNPNKYKRSGRPESLFAPRSARAARVFLQNLNRIWLQHELASATGLSAGYLSRLLPRYEEAGFISATQEGRSIRYQVTNPDAMLDSWRADYDFNHHTILRGHVASRGGNELLRDLSLLLNKQQIEYAATGLAGAWMWEPFASFRNVTLYLHTLPSHKELESIGFHVGERGCNTWLVVPNDTGVFNGQTVLNGICCVSLLQVYLDLKAQPERSEEAAIELRRVHLDWADMQLENKIYG